MSYNELYELCKFSTLNIKSTKIREIRTFEQYEHLRVAYDNNNMSWQSFTPLIHRKTIQNLQCI